MPMYNYKARDESGKSVSGLMEAASEDDLINHLRRLSCVPVTIEKTDKKKLAASSGKEFRFDRIKNEEIIVLNMQLSGMIDAGITLLSSLRVIAKQQTNPRLREIIETVAQQISGGSSFSDALVQHPVVFSKLYVSMVRAGETAGNLNVVLNRLAVYLEKQEELRQKIKGALTYPVILLVAGFFVILMIVTLVIPKFIVIFNKAGIPLPLPTQVLYGCSVLIKKYWYLLIMGVVAAVGIFKFIVSLPQGRLRIDRMILRVPIMGLLLRKVMIARFTRTLGELVDSGVPMIQALEVAKEMMGNEVMRRVVQTVRNNVEKGERLDQPLKMSGEFPGDAVHMISVGEETGKLGYMLGKVADFYDTSIEYTVKKMTTLIEPLFIVIMGAMVGFIMASMLIPIFDMVKTIQK